MAKELMTECVGAHEFCGSMTSCPLCEPVYPLRYEDGRFAPVEKSLDEMGFTVEDSPFHPPTHDEDGNFIPLEPPTLFISPKLKEEIERVFYPKEKE